MAALPNAGMESPLLGQARRFEIISFNDYPFATDGQVLQALSTDTHYRNSEIQNNYQYFLSGRYVVLNPSGMATPASNLLGMLSLEDIQDLRSAGLLLFNSATGEYLLMDSFGGNKIYPSLTDRFNARVQDKIENISTAARMNGLVRGVTEGEILDVDRYLVDSGLEDSADQASIRESVSEIYGRNLLILSDSQFGLDDDSSEIFRRNLATGIQQALIGELIPLDNVVTIIQTYFPEQTDRRSFYALVARTLPVDAVLRLLNAMELLHDFTWNDFDITDITKLDAIVPNLDDIEQVNSRQLLEKHILRFVIDFIDRNPSFTIHYQAIIRNITDKLLDAMVMGALDNPFEKIRKIEIVMQASLSRALRVRIGAK